MSLREPCVEAIADEILRWGIKPEKLPAGEKHLAGLVLDRLLAVLAEHSGEWLEASWEFAALPAPQRYVEALKPSTEEET